MWRRLIFCFFFLIGSIEAAPSPANNSSAFLMVEEGCGEAYATPASYGIDIHKLSDVPLEYEDERPKYLYKILSLDDWKTSGDIIHLPPTDHAFIHFSTEEQLPKIIDKYWRDIPEFIVLKIDTKKLSGTLVFETNPGGTTKYYHLYHGCIPRDAIVESTTVKH